VYRSDKSAVDMWRLAVRIMRFRWRNSWSVLFLVWVFVILPRMGIRHTNARG